MNQAFKLGLLVSSLNQVCGNKLKVETVVLVKPRTLVGPQRRLVSNFSPKSSNSVSMKEPNAAFGVAKENTVKGGVVETERIGNDSDCLERMTVQELRTKLRSIGVPAKGCKHDLVSALKNSISSNIDDEDSSIVEGSISSTVKSISSNQHAERTSGSLSNEEHTENVSMVPATSSGKRAKRTSEPSIVKINSTEVERLGHATKRSITSKETTGKKSIKVQRKDPLPISTVNIEASDKVDLFESKIEPWTIFAHKKPQKGWKVYNPKMMRPPPLSEDINRVKLMSWNVNGLRALLKLEAFSALEIAQREDFDILCLQETKLQEKDVEGIKQTLLEGFGNSYWTCSVSKLGYSGTAIISRIPPLSVRYGLGISDHDSEGRLVTAEFDTFYLLCGYVPNSSVGLKRLSYRVSEWDPSLGNYMKELEKLKPVILAGDLNCAHDEIDIYDPSGNKRSAGFTIEERMSFESNFLNKGFVDTFRKQHPGVVGYTYWGYRHGGRKTNKGWRLDYFLVSEAIADNVHDSYILPDITGSDHCPIGLVLKL